MKRTIRSNIHPPYSLHDRHIIDFDVEGDDVIMRSETGLVETTPPYGQPDGYVVFHGVRWDFSYVYLLDFTGNVGTFTGEKMFLKDFIAQRRPFGFSIMDETYGYNTTHFSGYLLHNRHYYECMMEIYHEGDMVFVTEE